MGMVLSAQCSEISGSVTTGVSTGSLEAIISPSPKPKYVQSGFVLSSPSPTPAITPSPTPILSPSSIPIVHVLNSTLSAQIIAFETPELSPKVFPTKAVERTEQNIGQNIEVSELTDDIVTKNETDFKQNKNLFAEFYGAFKKYSTGSRLAFSLSALLLILLLLNFKKLTKNK
jgi:hypothetical protein